MTRKVFFNLLFLFLTTTQFTTAQSIDSLVYRLDHVQGEEKIELLAQISSMFWWSDPEISLQYSKQMLKEAKSMGSESLIGDAYRLIGSAYFFLGNYDRALVNNQQALAIAEAVGDSTLMIRSLNNLGITNYDLGDFQLSMEYYMRAVEIMDLLDDLWILPVTLGNIGLIYERIGDFDKARDFAEQGMKVAKELGNQNYQVYSYNGIGISLLKKGKLAEAKQFLDSARLLAAQVGNGVWGSVASNKLGEVYLNLGLLDSASFYFNEALELSKSIRDERRIAEVLSNLSMLQLRRSNYPKAIEYLDQSQELARKYKSRHLLLDNLLAYSEVYKASGQNQLLVESQEDYLRYRDSLLTDIVGRSLELVPIKLLQEKERIQLSKQEAELKAQSFQNKVYLVVILISIPIAIIFYILMKRNKQQNEEIRKAQDLLIQSEKMASLGVLASGIGHEINNPLNYIKNGVNQIAKTVEESVAKDDSLLPKYMEIVNEGVDRTSKIVKSLANFSKLEVDHEAKCYVENVIEDCLIILTSKLKGIQVVKRFAPERLHVRGNESELHQVFMNILSNAVHAVSKQAEPVIEIATWNDISHAGICIKDNGYGISDENLSKINDPFFTTKSPGEGSGLGLFISHTILQKHNGEFQVMSSEGEGAEFIVRLPLFTEHR